MLIPHVLKEICLLIKYYLLAATYNDDASESGPDLGGSQGAQGPRPPTKRGPTTKPFNFHFALTIG